MFREIAFITKLKSSIDLSHIWPNTDTVKYSLNFSMIPTVLGLWLAHKIKSILLMPKAGRTVSMVKQWVLSERKRNRPKLREYNFVTRFKTLFSSSIVKEIYFFLKISRIKSMIYYLTFLYLRILILCFFPRKFFRSLYLNRLLWLWSYLLVYPNRKILSIS